MAVHRFRRVRRQAQPALTAASMPFDGSERRNFKNPVSTAGRMGWQTEAWDLFDRVGELRYYVSWRANSCSKIRLVASELDEEGKPTGRCENEVVRAIVNAIGGNQLGAAQFIKRAVEQLTVPGETFLGIIKTNETVLGQQIARERWLAFSRDEVRKTGTGTIITMPDGNDHMMTPDDSLWKCWQPHARHAKDCDSPVRANLDALREIVMQTKTIADAGKSRLLGAGVVFVPTEMSLPSSTAPVAADQPGATIALQGVPAVRELEELLYEVARVSYADDESFARMIPIFASVAGDQVKNISHLKFDNEITDTAIKIRNDAIARLALGLDVSPERMLGLGSSTNHWSAWQIGDNDVQMHLAPVMELLCESLTDRILRAMLMDAGMDEAEMDNYVVWYDASELTADPDKSDDATDAFDRGVITAEAYREFLNLGATGYDLTTREGWAAWARDQLANDPSQIIRLQPLIPELKGIEFPEIAAIEAQVDQSEASAEATRNPPAADTTNEGNSPDTQDNAPGEDQGKRGRKKDVGKRVVTPHDALLQVFVTRALELAGKRRRNTGDARERDRLRGYKAHEFHRLMPAVDEDRIPKLIEGWDETLEDDVLRVLNLPRGQFEDRVRAEVRRQLTAQVITVDQ